MKKLRVAHPRSTNVRYPTRSMNFAAGIWRMFSSGFNATTTPNNVAVAFRCLKYKTIGIPSTIRYDIVLNTWNKCAFHTPTGSPSGLVALAPSPGPPAPPDTGVRTPSFESDASIRLFA